MTLPHPVQLLRSQHVLWHVSRVRGSTWSTSDASHQHKGTGWETWHATCDTIPSQLSTQ